MALKIGITESTDPSYDTSWRNKITGVDGLIIITKNIRDEDMRRLIQDAADKKPVIVHATCTGWGGTKIEPNVPELESTMWAIENLIHNGFPARNIVLRLDPILPTKEGLERAESVLAALEQLNVRLQSEEQKIVRVRVSVMDNYKHVVKRFVDKGLLPLYNGKFQADYPELRKVIDLLGRHSDFEYSACAETRLVEISKGMVVAEGCISKKDLDIMELIPDTAYENPQNRKGCHCLACKTELLAKTNHTCPLKCLYCYWKRSGE